MREMGGYIELDTYRGTMMYDNAIKLNCGRNALWYILKARNIKKILMPYFMCSSCDRIFDEQDVMVRKYSVDLNFLPWDIERENDEWLYIVNYYGQLSEDQILTFGDKIIVDNSQAYFSKPIEGVDTFYSCRKFFGVADGAMLFTDKTMSVEEQDESFSRAGFLLGRYERPAGEFYSEYVRNNESFACEPIKRMSALTENLLRGIDYKYVMNRRRDNFMILHSKLKDINMLSLKVPEGAFMYPLMIDNASKLRTALINEKIYIPTLWQNVIDECVEGTTDHMLAANIIPLPVDQRYDDEDMEYVAEMVISMNLNASRIISSP